ncbi:unnamed protein product [Leptidea sinapis]|uniref:Uncharacterized protein n=1 Tax=Leptidea sinapis TaxID=189913 RepID=A0A5E4R0E4_9NEOP|nr:unnamed protein product [Leptidea sinapis]
MLSCVRGRAGRGWVLPGHRPMSRSQLISHCSGSDSFQRVSSPNPEGKSFNLRRGSPALPVQGDACRELLAGCAALCAQLGLRRSFSAGDVSAHTASPPVRSAISEVGMFGGSQLPLRRSVPCVVLGPRHWLLRA